MDNFNIYLDTARICDTPYIFVARAAVAAIRKQAEDSPIFSGTIRVSKGGEDWTDHFAED